ncbi:serine hydrolase domain-containing protein [Kitasatospora purpeofusca]|uniref:serine hydrolase domain-containing protein n=1 Tax=Kitasatospora purpeofusca TaxID=67352 RepID=UPI0022565F9A|nr:serine hydrolase domain-containing protein [Kitasatospora purpeofusca]MCX4758405.1 beta-lactamase family protein [Kitasatospora purpeofusca]WSR31143.1 beta-lactamase family protein [Kitasatospora purpeofusca]WSR39179.1 beta-lactamase family protein [Kitasatospora purpeofusca]
MNEHAPQRRAHSIRLVRYAMTAAATAGLALTAFAPAPAAAAPRPDTVQQRLDALVKDNGVPAALASVKGRDGRNRTYTAGVGDLATGARVPVDGQIRAGSNTKAFVAVVVLQLVAEGKVGLDASVDTYLPGLLRGDGFDGRNITVRQLLQHTSGLPDYMDAPALADFTTIQYRWFEPRELLDGALAQKARFAAGTGWEYSNTNYLVAGLLIQKVTGRPYGEELTKRVIERIGLRHTYVPAAGETALRETHPHGYLRTAPDAPLVDYTAMDSSMAWAAGAVVSTNTDLNAFYGALLGGRLLPAAQLAQMRTTVPAEFLGEGVRYGLGIQSRPLTCGGLVWGHGGTSPGFRTRGGVTEDGRAANITVTVIPDAATGKRLTDAVDVALCR